MAILHVVIFLHVSVFYVTMVQASQVAQFPGCSIKALPWLSKRGSQAALLLGVPVADVQDILEHPLIDALLVEGVHLEHAGEGPAQAQTCRADRVLALVDQVDDFDNDRVLE